MASTTSVREKRIDDEQTRDYFTLAQLPNGTDLTNLHEFEEYCEARKFAEDTMRRLADDD